MGEARLLASSPIRLKRETHHRTKHDPNFSKWLVLVGPTDWEDHSLGKEGATRYKVHNLPATSAPGLYELGLAGSSSGLGPEDIVVVYLGQADSVRTRLQSYGRSGAHLGSKCSCGGGCGGAQMGCVQKGPDLFDEVFRRDFSVAFRWAPMKDKRNAEWTEAQLLDTFDYAWNKGANGLRRPDDILRKLDDVSSSSIRFPSFSKRVLRIGRGGVGIRIEANKPVRSDEDSKSFFPWILKSSRSPPAVASDGLGSIEDLDYSAGACGIVIDHGSPCKRPPVPGRRRCEEHKGMRICRSIYDGNSSSDTANRNNVEQFRLIEIACGVNLGEGTFCKKPAVSGRKRCEEHKGMKVNSFRSKPKAEEETTIPATPETPTGPIINNASCSNTSCGDPRNESGNCGATLENGSFCRRRPVRGNKRCWQHKGRKADAAALPRPDTSFPKCGVTLADGSVCVAAPLLGRKRCERHKGMRVAARS